MRRVGVLAPSTRAKEEVTLKPFFDQMRELGWIEGQNIAYDRVYADDQHERLPALAAELVARKPELIYAPPAPSALAVKRATQTIPIVFGVGAGPGRHRAGGEPGAPGRQRHRDQQHQRFAAPKRVELLREILPGVKRLGLLGDPTDPNTKIELQALAPAAAALGLTIIVAEVAHPGDFDAAVARLVAERVEVIYLLEVALVFNLRSRVVELANQKRVPVINSTGCGALRLRRLAGRSTAALGTAGGQDTQGRQAGRPAGGATDRVRAGGQPEDRQGTRHHHPAVHPAACGQRSSNSLAIGCPVWGTPVAVLNVSDVSTAPVGRSRANDPNQSEAEIRHQRVTGGSWSGTPVRITLREPLSESQAVDASDGLRVSLRIHRTGQELPLGLGPHSRRS